MGQLPDERSTVIATERTPAPATEHLVYPALQHLDRPAGSVAMQAAHPPACVAQRHLAAAYPHTLVSVSEHRHKQILGMPDEPAIEPASWLALVHVSVSSLGPTQQYHQDPRTDGFEHDKTASME